MPRVAVPVTDITRAGVDPAEVNGDAVNNHELAYGPHVLLVARNNSATVARLVTLRLAKTIDGQAPTNRTVSVPLSSRRYIGPFTEDYRQSDDKIYVDVEHADLKLTAFRTP